MPKVKPYTRRDGTRVKGYRRNHPQKLAAAGGGRAAFVAVLLLIGWLSPPALSATREN